MVVVGAPGAGLYALAPLGAGGAVPDGRDTAGAPTGDVTAATEAGGDGGSRGDQDVDNGVVAVAASDIEVSSSKVVAALLDDHVEDLRRAGLWPTDTPGGEHGGCGTADAASAAMAAEQMAAVGAPLKRGAVDAGWGLPTSDSGSEGCNT
ncbi:hypothetical protein MMPV_002870 [Pyropia vietnamensis]